MFDELLALLKTVNAEHQAIVKPEIDEEATVERWARDTSKYSLAYQRAGSMIDGVLTAQQAKNDCAFLQPADAILGSEKPGVRLSES